MPASVSSSGKYLFQSDSLTFAFRGSMLCETTYGGLMSDNNQPKVPNYFLPQPLPVPNLDNGLCRGMPTSWWFPDAAPSPEQRQRSARAIELCEQCPELKRCLDFALKYPSVQGIWGGTFPRQRRRMRISLGIKD